MLGDSKKPAARHLPFRICLSVEKDEAAFKTLRLRSFYRALVGMHRKIPSAYYEYVSGKIDDFSLLGEIEGCSDAFQQAEREVLCAELGKYPHDKLKTKVRQRLKESGNKDCVIIGGPPCQAYSIVGRSRMRGKVAGFDNDERHFLYREYLRTIADHSPLVFVMENVKGMLSAQVNGENIFEKIVSDLENPHAINGNSASKRGKAYEYRIYSLVKKPRQCLFDQHFESSDYVIQAEEHGIPQTRHRVILIGIRSDVNLDESACDRLVLAKRDPVTIEEVISDLPEIRSRLSRTADSPRKWKEAALSGRRLILDNVCGDLKVAMRRAFAQFRQAADLPEGSEYCGRTRPGRPRKTPKYTEWYNDDRLTRVCNHSGRAHIKEDLWRYFFVANYARIHEQTPRIKDFPKVLLPKHRNIKLARKGQMFCDRFRVQLEGRTATTITSHIRKDGHYFIHYDPLQCRSLTVREAARLQTFPDNYFFEGGRTDQYRQVGNAVTPDWLYHRTDVLRKMDPACNSPDTVEYWTGIDVAMYQSLDRTVARIVEAAGRDAVIMLVSDHGAKGMGRTFSCVEALAEAGLTTFATDAVTGTPVVDCATSRAVPLPQSGPWVFVNLKGRDPDGVVDPEDFEEVCGEIIHALTDYEDPETGDRPVAFALTKRDARPLGLHGDRIGDVIYALTEKYGGNHGGLPTSRDNVGSLKGLFIMSGPGVKKNTVLERTVCLTDIVPTLCQLTNVPVPRHCEGAIIYQALTDIGGKAKELEKLRKRYDALRKSLGDTSFEVDRHK